MIGREEKVYVLETTIDDMNPEIYAYLVEKMLREGALDAFTTPVQMKKGRPANRLNVICREEMLEKILQIIFRETSTIGVRYREEKRRVLPRKFKEVELPWGRVRIKLCFFAEDEGEIIQAAPEFEDCRRLAEENGVPLKDVYEAACAAVEKLKKSRR